jgi:hypothetical protein
VSNPILLVTRYFNQFNQLWKDGCLLLALYGLTVVWGASS